VRARGGTQKNLPCHTLLALGGGVAPSPHTGHPDAGASPPRWLSDGGAVPPQRPWLPVWPAPGVPYCHSAGRVSGLVSST
jgi:hypothetical protein